MCGAWGLGGWPLFGLWWRLSEMIVAGSCQFSVSGRTTRAVVCPFLFVASSILTEWGFLPLRHHPAMDYTQDVRCETETRRSSMSIQLKSNLVSVMASMFSARFGLVATVDVSSSLCLVCFSDPLAIYVWFRSLVIMFVL